MEQNKVASAVQQRITVLDALRGFALLGVVSIHMLQHYGIYSFGGGAPQESMFSAFDESVRWLQQNVLMGRFINIFAFLFGISFFIQMDRAARKGVDFRKRFLWRMMILFTIGMIGNCFYTGDILSIYAVFGILMVFLFRVKNWILLVLVSLLLMGMPRVITTEYRKMVSTEQVATTTDTPARPAFRAQDDAEKASFFSQAKRNLTTGMEGKLNYQFGLFGRGYLTLALFILGLVVGRTRFFEEVHTKKKRNLYLFASFVLAHIIIGWVAGLLPEQQTGFAVFMRPDAQISPLLLVLTALNDINVVVFSGILVMGFIILYQTNVIGRCLDLLSPYGRMGLTNYEMQGVIGCLLFSSWSFGAVFGNWGATQVFLLGLVVYALQVVASRYWLKYFLYGPLEWFWRSATYLKLQPFRRK